MRRVRRALAAVALTGAIASVTGATLAAFSDTSVNSGNTITAKRIFPGVRATTGWTISDVADGTAANVSDPTTAADGSYGSTSNWNNAYATNRYVSTDFLATLPAGLAVSSAMLRMDIAANGGANNLCFYFDVIQTSTGTVLASHGNSTTPAGCVTGTTITSVNTALPEVASTDVANDLTVKIYAKDTGKSAMRIDRAVVTGSTPYDSFTLYRAASVDSADTSAATSIWAPAAADGTFLQTGGNFPGTFASTKYVDVTFPPGHVTTGATINSTVLAVKFKSGSAGKALCVYYEAYSGATLLGTYGNSASPYCSDTSGNWRTDTVAIPGVDTVAKVNGLRVRIYGRVSGGGSGQFDLIQLRPDYQLD
jgi:predicted ribosomally synthesized peptide with SipW-like signal peptide